MPRVNERCIEHTAGEYRVDGVMVLPGHEVLATAQDLNGAKIHCCWVKIDKPGTVEFDYLCRKGETTLETRGPLDLDVGKYTRFQFGTYKAELPLPAMNLRIRVRNTSDEPAKVTLYGMSQLQ